MINSPFKWAGGKSRLRKHIIPLIPEHSCYVEPFCGAAWVLFGKSPSKVEVLNDIDQDVINFFRVVKHKPEQLIESFEWELVSRAEYERLAKMNTSELNDVERAHRFYYLIMAGWGGEANYPRFATSITDGGHGNRLFGALKTLRKRVEPVHTRLKTVILECLSWEDCIDRYDREKTVMYIDPPYPENGVNYKFNMREWEQHEKLAKRLAESKCRWLVSSYDTAEVRELFGDYEFVRIRSYSGMATNKSNSSRVLNEEIVIVNFELDSNIKYPHNRPGQKSLEQKRIEFNK